MHQEIIRFSPQQSQLAEIFQIYQITHEFHREAHHRQAWKTHCRWYQAVCTEHQQELSQRTKTPG